MCDPDPPVVVSEPHVHTPDSIEIESRYPVRDRKPPKHLGDFITNIEDNDQVLSTIDYCYKAFMYPQSFKEAVESSESDNWMIAMKEEMISLTENDTFTLTHLPEGRKAVGGHWVYTNKENPNDSQTYKARYVAKVTVKKRV